MNTILQIVKNNLSRTIIWMSLLIVTVVNISYENWNNDYKIISWDVNSYYAYLPMVFIYQDLDMDFMTESDDKFLKHYWPISTQTGKKAIVTSVGMAYLYSPFFLAGHGVAHLTGYENDEFSPPYKISLIISCLFFLTVGLIFLRKVLLNYFSDLETTLGMVTIIFGTNLLHYVTEEPTMSHAYSFSLISAFLYLIIKWFKNPGIKYAVLTGVIAGLIALVRPSNVIIILLLVFWDITSIKGLGDRLLFYLKRSHLVLIMILAFIIVWVPQFAYWHYTSGSIFFNTYGSVGAGFFFDQPQIYHTLFSYRKGWLVYTPMMVFAITGIYFLYRDQRKLFIPVLLFLLVNTYVISSWWCWWYGGGFGLRPFIDSYGIMALPLTAFIAWIIRQVNILKIPLLVLITAITFVNIFQIAQFKRGVLHYVNMTRISYWEVFMDMTPSRRYWNNLIFPDYEAAKEGRYYTENEISEFQKQQTIENKKMEIQDYIDKIRNNPAFMEMIEEKAKKWGISVDSAVIIDAGWLYRNNEKNK